MRCGLLSHFSFSSILVPRASNLLSRTEKPGKSRPFLYTIPPCIKSTLSSQKKSPRSQGDFSFGCLLFAVCFFP